MTVCAILAAGLSKRFGQPKQLARFEEETLIRRAVRIALGAGCDRTLVVIPGETPQISAAIDDLKVEVLENPDAAAGMSTSIRLAVTAARGENILLTLCDQPLVTSEHLRNLLATNAPIAATGFAGAVGPPAYFEASFAPELLALHGDRGARTVLEAHRAELVTVPFQDAAFDIDTVADLR